MFDCLWVSDVLNHNAAQKASSECRDFVINLAAIFYYYYLFIFSMFLCLYLCLSLEMRVYADSIKYVSGDNK